MAQNMNARRGLSYKQTSERATQATELIHVVERVSGAHSQLYTISSDLTKLQPSARHATDA